MQLFPTEHSPESTIVTHRHALPYISLIVEGEYLESSADGSYFIGQGSLVCHPAHHIHSNRFAHKSTEIINLEMPFWSIDSYRVLDLGSNLAEARDALFAGVSCVLPMLSELNQIEGVTEIAPDDWLGYLAAELSNPQQSDSIQKLCRRVGISAEHASRCFKLHYGIAPQQYRREHRLRAACQALRSGEKPSHAAHFAGFADQSHFGRVMRTSFGITPSRYPALFH